MPDNLSERRSSDIIRDFEAKVRKGCLRSGLTDVKGHLLVGFSGGADSTALLLSLKSLMSGGGRWPASLVAVHVEHGLRPGSSERDARHAEEFCQSHKISFRRVGVRVEESGGRGLEDAARRARRRAFVDAARETGARAVALAHTQDDQAETVLMHLFEGAGVRGIAGIRPRNRLEVDPPCKGDPSNAGEPSASNIPEIEIFRPLLEISRTEIEDYLRARDTGWVEDESNANETRLRNLVRRQVIPIIRKNMGTGVIGRIAGSANHAADAAEALIKAVDDARNSFLSEENRRVRLAPVTGFILLPRAVRAGVWAAALDRVDQPGGRRRALERLIENLDHLAVEESPSAQVSLAGGMAAWRRYDAIYMGPESEYAPPPQGEVPLAIPGRTRHEELGLEINAELGEYEQFQEGGEDSGGKMTALFDPALLPKGIVLRNRRAGDRFRPAGAPGDRKLKEFFIDRKIPRPERDFIPILAFERKVIWVVGQAVSGRYQGGAASVQATPRHGKRLILKARLFRKTFEK